ncbi:myosin-M heavy chain-like [Spodoptera frugiperda]|uniref:Myosin-M heavy chain-like n=1 Tax=Spodoptera frugiperda TaxID=7108 RepID=A0A9R0CVV4_SPOFR|nr:myosin-M heavy chain-like [Spodoptera frugiperda]
MFGFKASLNFYNGSRRKTKKERAELGAVLSVTGAYRTNRDDSFGYNYPDTRKSTPALNNNQPMPAAAPPPVRPIRQAKSTSDLILDKNLPPNLRPENPGVSKDPRGAEQDPRNNRIPDKSKERKLDAQIRVDKQRLEEQKKLEKQRIEEQKKLEKQRIAEQKKRDKLLLKEQARKEKLRREMEKQSKKSKAPPPPMANGANKANPVAQVRQPQPQTLPPGANPVAQLRQQPQPSTSNAQPTQMTNSTNTLESSISKSSGPPPYSAAKPEGEKDATGNVTYAKPEEEDSWDLISKHRENMNRAAAAAAATAASKSAAKQTVMDLNYKIGEESKDNSEA